MLAGVFPPATQEELLQDLAGTFRSTVLFRGKDLDTGTPDSMQAAASYIMALEERQGLKVACPEEIAFRMGLIDEQQLLRISESYKDSAYGRYVRSLLVDHPSIDV